MLATKYIGTSWYPQSHLLIVRWQLTDCWGIFGRIHILNEPIWISNMTKVLIPRTDCKVIGTLRYITHWHIQIGCWLVLEAPVWKKCWSINPLASQISGRTKHAINHQLVDNQHDWPVLHQANRTNPNDSDPSPPLKKNQLGTWYQRLITVTQRRPVPGNAHSTRYHKASRSRAVRLILRATQLFYPLSLARLNLGFFWIPSFTTEIQQLVDHCNICNHCIIIIISIINYHCHH